MQTRLLHPCSARQPAVQPAQQNPRRGAFDRSLSVRRTNPPRRIAETLRRTQRRGRPLHRVPPLRQTLPRQYRLRRRYRGHPQPVEKGGQTPLQPRRIRRTGLFERQRPARHQPDAQRRGSSRLQNADHGLRFGEKTPFGRGQPEERAENHGRQTVRQRTSHPLCEPPAAAPCAAANRPRHARHRRRQTHPHHPQPRTAGRYRSRVLLPRLRLGTPVLPSRVGHAGHAVARRRANRAAAGLPVLRLSAKRPRRCRQSGQNGYRQPRPVPPHGQHLELSRHQNRRRLLRNLLRRAGRIPLRRNLPRLPHHRHPRIFAGKRRETARHTGHGIPVPRSLPHADQDHEPDQTGG